MLPQQTLNALIYQISNGLTIDQACKKVCISRKEMYTTATHEQKQELRAAKAITQPTNYLNSRVRKNGDTALSRCTPTIDREDLFFDEED